MGGAINKTNETPDHFTSMGSFRLGIGTRLNSAYRRTKIIIKQNKKQTDIDRKHKKWQEKVWKKNLKDISVNKIQWLSKGTLWQHWLRHQRSKYLHKRNLDKLINPGLTNRTGLNQFNKPDILVYIGQGQYIGRYHRKLPNLNKSQCRTESTEPGFFMVLAPHPPLSQIVML